jgi:hypothetical protein
VRGVVVRSSKCYRPAKPVSTATARPKPARVERHE